ncbi:MAG: shikimate dehydrogenase [Rhodospirillales bacterium]
MTGLSGAAKLAGVLGWPVSHSRSPRLHGHWLRRYGIDGAYLPLPVRPDDFETVFRALPKAGFAGVNVTIPHKEMALSLADEADDLARRIAAANTIIFREDGSSLASNTDGFGFLMNLQDQAPDWKADAPAVVLGAGGAARAVLVALIDRGVPEIRLLNRTRARAEAIAGDLGSPVHVMDWQERETALPDAGLLVNTTSLGMEGHPPLEIRLDDLSPQATVADIVYAPVETPLLAAAKAQACRTVTGPGMLLHQAVPGFEAWFGHRPVVDDALRQAAFPEIYGTP